MLKPRFFPGDSPFLATAKSRTLDAVHAEDDVCFISSAIREVN